METLSDLSNSVSTISNTTIEAEGIDFTADTQFFQCNTHRFDDGTLRESITIFMLTGTMAVRYSF